MQGFLTIPKRVHQAAIAGLVVDAETERPVVGVYVAITGMPEGFSQQLALVALQRGAAWELLAERPDRTRTASDGCFRFLDLPDGDYVLSFSVPGDERHHGDATHGFAITRDAEGKIAVQFAEIALPTTGVRGCVQGTVLGAPAALPLARVRVAGTGEQTFAKADGNFFLTGVETGPRALQISASGFLPTAVDVQISKGTVTDVGTIVLDPATT